MSKIIEIKRHVKPGPFVRMAVAGYIHKTPILLAGICVGAIGMFIFPPTFMESLNPIDHPQEEVSLSLPAIDFEFPKTVVQVEKEKNPETKIESINKTNIVVDKKNEPSPIKNVTPQVEMSNAANTPAVHNNVDASSTSQNASLIEDTVEGDTEVSLEDPTSYVIPTPVPKPLSGSSKEKATEHVLSKEVQDLKDRLTSRLSEARQANDSTQIEIAERELEIFENTIAAEIDFRIVDRDNEKSGFWRAESQDGPKQFFVVVEALYNGEVVNWAVRDFDTNTVVSTSKFGLRVDEQVFRSLSDDKKEDGRINNRQIGLKPVGSVSPIWSIKTSGETITGF